MSVPACDAYERAGAAGDEGVHGAEGAAAPPLDAASVVRASVAAACAAAAAVPLPGAAMV